MTKRYSITEDRQNLAAIVHELEQHGRVELTRRGRPVAVMLSMREFERMAGARARFWEAYEAFRATVDLPHLGVNPSVFEEARKRSPGRAVEL